MTVETNLFTRLTTFAGLAALITARAYPMRLPQTPTLPAVVYQKISNARIMAHDGDAALAGPRFQVTAWALTYLAAQAVAEQVRLALQGSTSVGAGLYANALDFYDPETGWYSVPVDFMILN